MFTTNSDTADYMEYRYFCVWGTNWGTNIPKTILFAFFPTGIFSGISVALITLGEKPKHNWNYER